MFRKLWSTIYRLFGTSKTGDIDLFQQVICLDGELLRAFSVVAANHIAALNSSDLPKIGEKHRHGNVFVIGKQVVPAGDKNRYLVFVRYSSNAQ